MVRGKIRSGSLVSSTMFTESSKPTIAKNAIDVAAVTARNRPLSLGVLEGGDPVEVAVALGDDVEADADHDRERGDLDQGEDHVELHRLADAAQVDQREQHHEAERDQR